MGDRVIYLTALAAALMPAIPLVQVSTAQLAKARSYWLLGLLTLAICWLAWSELWLALIGFAFLCRWRSPAELPSLVAWGGVAASWFLLLHIPRDLYDWIVLGWLAVALWQVGVLMDRYARMRRRMVGTFGSPVLTGLYLAAVLPLAPLWVVPILGIGLVLTSSIAAGGAVAVAMVWRFPWTWPLPLATASIILVLWAYSPTVKGRRILEWSLRGDTADSVWARWYAWRVIVHELRQHPQHWVFGIGPGSAVKALRQWGSRLKVELPYEVTNEALQLVYEYGLIGGLAALAFVWRVGSHLTLGDPWSAAWVGFLVLSFTHWPLRHPLIGPVFLAVSVRVVLV